MKIQFPTEQIIARMKFENPWWLSGSIEQYYSNMKRREYYKMLFPLVQETEIKRAVVLMGPRRVGKTVLLFQTIQGLIDVKVPPGNICYFSVETPIYNGVSLDELLGYFFQIQGVKNNSGLFIFFDEIQYLKNWEIHLKSLVDSYHNIKFIVSGSAAAALKLKSTESGAGRFTDFVLPPLTFYEYLSLKGINTLIIDKTYGKNINGEQYAINDYEYTDIKELNRHFVDYINFGGYPEVSLSQSIQSDAGRYIRNDIIDKVLLRDLPVLYGIEDIQELNSLFNYITYNTGNEMSLESISQSSGVSKNTIKKYITYLEAAFLIKVVHRIDNNGKKFKRANFFKVYLTNPSLRSALFSPIQEDDPFMGNMVETAIYSQWQHAEYPLYYARWNNGEVDIVYLNAANQKPEWVVEIKWSNNPTTDYKELKNIRQFCNIHHMQNCTITTYDKKIRIINENIEFYFTPASLYCYTVGRNLITDKKWPGLHFINTINSIPHE
ncbi:MAG TPA: ATP-binding protein [Chitinophagaceae bacterium]|nr:ATP-binding protein [Chitinophagaceae bacterium]